MTDTTPINPYLNAAETEALPFVGRQKAFERLYQQLTDTKAATTIILGRRQVGKTALLQQFHTFFDESFVSVYVPLKEVLPDDEAAWLKMLAGRTIAALAERGFTLSHLPDEPPAEGDLRIWFEEKFLREVLNIIRRYRRLVYLMDDAEALLRSVQAGQTGTALHDFLHHLLEVHPNFRMVMTLDADYEADVPALSPLVALTDVFRLMNLSAEESLQLLQEPVQPFYTVLPEAAAAVYQATGGQPQLLQRSGYHLFRLYQAAPALNTMTPDHVKQIAPFVYTESVSDFRHIWQHLNQNEQLVLRAITELLYNDPITPISTQAIASWLIETDFPLDSTAIHATLRSLEYRELVSTAPIQITAGLMQMWLLDNVRQSPPVLKAVQTDEMQPSRKNNWRIVAAGAAGLILLVVLILSIMGLPRNSAELLPQPTVTLVTTPARP